MKTCFEENMDPALLEWLTSFEKRLDAKLAAQVAGLESKVTALGKQVKNVQVMCGTLVEAHVRFSAVWRTTSHLCSL